MEFEMGTTAQATPMKHSGLGIASFILSIVIAFLIFLLLMVAGIMEATTPGGMDEESAGAMIVGLFTMLFMFIDFVALGLGIAGLFHRERKKIFAILGTIFSGVTFLGTVMLILIGSMME